MGSGRISTAAALLASAVFAALLALGTVPYANADNVVANVASITMDAGTTNTQLKVKIVSSSSNDPSGDDQDGCNAADGTPARVHLSISPSEGLTASPNPIEFNKCGNPAKTVTLTGVIGGTYEITATVEDDRTTEPIGDYHVQPFGTVIVVVVDTTAPETTIDSGPADRTANHTAVFTFSANEESTFECSLDDITYDPCTSPATYSPLDAGDYTFYVRATDLSGNTDQTPASYPWTIANPTIEITSIDPSSATWGTPVTVIGTTDVVDLSGLFVRIAWGDGEESDIVIAGDGSWTGDHTYASAGQYTITAFLRDDTEEKASDSEQVQVSKRNAILEVSTPSPVTGETKFVASGKLVDASSGEGIDGLEIEFSDDGAPDDVTTQGVGFFGTIEIMACPVGDHPVDPDDCTADDIGQASDTENRVLHLQDGGSITFPPSSAKVRILLQQMGDTPFTYTVTEYPNTVQQCPPPNEALTECPVTSFANAPLEIIAESGASEIGGVIVYNGIKEISFTPGIDIGIASLSTRIDDTDPPQALHQITFDDLDLGTRDSGFTVDSGFFFAIGVSQFEPENGLILTAELAENDFYTAADATASYNVEANMQSPAGSGVGTTSVQSTGTSITKRGVTGDLDDDGLGDTDEGSCLARNPVNTAETWTYAPSQSYSSAAADCPKRGGVSGAVPDLYYEVDCMAGVTCPTQAELDLLEKAFDDTSSTKDINAHFHLSDTGLCSAGQNVVGWFDGSSAAGSERCDDFRSIKLYNYGTGTENDGGCTLASSCGTLLARSQAVGYILIVDGINGCSTTGLGELYGRDVMVGTDCIFKVHDSANVRNAMLGTMLHEIGHNNGLGHGGGKADHTRDDTNCKPNHISVMTYPRQVPTDAMQAGSASASSAVQWYLGYHRGEVRLTSTSGSASLNEGGIADDKLVITNPNAWKNRDRATTIASFKVLWGDLPFAVRSGFTGNTLSWDGGRANDPSIDLNGVPDVFVNGFQLPACTESAQLTSLASPPDELVTIRNNLDEFQKTGTGISALGVGDFSQDPDINSELNFPGVNLLNSLQQFEFLGVKNPLTNVGFDNLAGASTHKKGNTIPVQFNFEDSDGNEVTGDNASTYGIQWINMTIALISDPSTPPADAAYFKPQTSTQPGSIDFFTWDGSKWSFSMGSKNLITGGTYAGRITVHFFNGTPEGQIMDHNGDTISFVFKVVKG